MKDNTMFIFLDDVRNPPADHWIVVRTAEAAYTMIREFAAIGCEMVVSLDHDLGDNMRTGYDLVSWLEKDVFTDGAFRPEMTMQIHSANPVGRSNMEAGIKAINKVLKPWL